MSNFYLQKRDLLVSLVIEETGKKVSQILTEAKYARARLLQPSIHFDDRYDSLPEKDSRQNLQLEYLKALNELPFTEAIAEKTREEMGVEREEIRTVMDFGSAYCPDLPLIDASMQDREKSTLICVDSNEFLLRKSSEHYQENDCSIQLFPVLAKAFSSAKGDSHIPFDDNTVDACRTVRTLQHIDDPQHIVSEMCRVTSPGGKVVMVDPDWTSFRISPQSEIDHDMLKKVHQHSEPVPYPETGRLLKEYAQEAGLEGVEEQRITLQTDIFERVDLIGGFRSEFPKMIKEGLVSEEESEEFLSTLHRDLEDGTAVAQMDYYLVSGIVPQEP